MAALLPLAAAVALAAGASSCLFLPNIEPHGYVRCEADGDCEPGRYCGEGLCAPPPWHDDRFAQRRLLVVKNEDSAPIPAGTAVPVLIGGDTGLLSLADVGPDLRFADFDRASSTWKVVPVFLDREEDRFTAWIPTQREIPQGKSDVLAWIESATPERLPTVVEDPVGAFDSFDAFEADTINEDIWRRLGTGGGPIIDGGVARVADNQALVLQRPLTGPVVATVLARVNGTTCDDVFIGLVGDDRALLTVPPAAGFFVDTDLQGDVVVGPTAESQLRPMAPLTAGTALARYIVAVDGSGVRALLNGEALYEELDLRPPFDPQAPLHLAIQVGGACSVDVETVWVAPLPLPAPVVTAGPLVQLQLFQ